MSVRGLRIKAMLIVMCGKRQYVAGRVEIVFLFVVFKTAEAKDEDSVLQQYFHDAMVLSFVAFVVCIVFCHCRLKRKEKKRFEQMAKEKELDEEVCSGEIMQELYDSQLFDDNGATENGMKEKKSNVNHQ